MKYSRQTLFAPIGVWKNQHYMMKVHQAKAVECLSCGMNRPYPYLSYENETKTEVLCGRNTVQIRPAHKTALDIGSLSNKLVKHGKVEVNLYLVSLSLANHRLVFFCDGRVFVHGTNEIAKAKSLYYQFIG